MTCSLDSESYKLHQLLQSNNYAEIEELIKLIEGKTFHPKEQRGITSLLIKYYLKVQNYDKVESILNRTDGLMKRDYLNYICSIYNVDKMKAMLYFETVIRYEILTKDIDFIIMV